MIAVLLALLAGVLLAVGYLREVTALAWSALAVAAVAGVLVVLPRYTGWATPPTGVSDAEFESDFENEEENEDERRASPPEPEAEPTPKPEPSPSVAEVVMVIPGRRRFHKPSCELLSDHPVQQLTEEEALEEEFTACTRCLG